MRWRFVLVFALVLGCSSGSGLDAATDEFAEGESGWEGGTVPPSQVDEPCGPLTPCIAGAFCLYSEFQGGEWCDYLGECTLPPSECDDEEAVVVCGCDGVVYPSACAAHAMGMSVGSAEACPLPAGSFACGNLVCVIDEEYCEYTVPHGQSESWRCNPLVCSDGEQGCACISDAPCGDPEYFPGQWCDPEASGGVIVTCVPA